MITVYSASRSMARGSKRRQSRAKLPWRRKKTSQDAAQEREAPPTWYERAIYRRHTGFVYPGRVPASRLSRRHTALNADSIPPRDHVRPRGNSPTNRLGLRSEERRVGKGWKTWTPQ